MVALYRCGRPISPTRRCPGATTTTTTTTTTDDDDDDDADDDGKHDNTNTNTTTNNNNNDNNAEGLSPRPGAARAPPSAPPGPRATA